MATSSAFTQRSRWMFSHRYELAHLFYIRILVFFSPFQQSTITNGFQQKNKNLLFSTISSLATGSRALQAFITFSHSHIKWLREVDHNRLLCLKHKFIRLWKFKYLSKEEKEVINIRNGKATNDRLRKSLSAWSRFFGKTWNAV